MRTRPLAKLAQRTYFAAVSLRDVKRLMNLKARGKIAPAPALHKRSRPRPR